MFSRIFALIMKEIASIWQDKRSRFFLFGPPLFQLFIFSFAATLDVKNNSIGVLNRDYGKYSFELVQRFKGSKFFDQVYSLKNPEEMVWMIENEKISTALQFDEEFSRNILQMKPAKVQLILDGKRSNTAQIVFGYTSKIIDQFNRDIAIERGEPVSNSVLVQRNWYNPNLIYTWFTVPGLIGVLSMLVALIITALSLAREKELGTFEQLLVTPLRPLEIIIGKTIPGIIIGLIQGSFMLLAALLIFQIPFTGTVIYLYLSLLVFIISIIGIGLFISSLCRTQQQAMLGVFMFMAPAVALSGFATPIENTPHWIQTITLANPLRHFLIVVRGTFLTELSGFLVFQSTYPMAIIAIFTITGSVWFFKKRIY